MLLTFAFRSAGCTVLGTRKMRLDADILDAGLALAMEFGEHWLEPIQARLAEKHPELSVAELNAYDAACRKAMTFGHELVPNCFRQAAGSRDEAARLFRKAAREQFPWISDATLSHLFSQGSYYAWKNGELPY